MKKIYYWSPCLSKVGTYKATINSMLSCKRFNKKIEISIINCCGEWDDCQTLFINNNIKIKQFKLKLFKFLPKHGFFKSRFSNLIISLLSIFPLFKLLKKEKPDYLIIHLLTSLPLLLLNFFNFETKFILRISGYPKLHLIRKFLWKKISNKLFRITCPSKELKNQLIKKKIFNSNKIVFLPDPVLMINQIIKKKKENISNHQKYLMAAGRLTKQKNFSYLIHEFYNFCNYNKKNNLNLLIFGEGEEYQSLNKIIKNYNFENKVYLMGHSENLYKYMKNAEAFILSSKWEDPGFVIIEAAISNLFIISSNCENGPSELLDYGKGGLLFKNNKKGALKDALEKFFNLENTFQQKKIAKKNCKNYTIFKHYKNLNEILN